MKRLRALAARAPSWARKPPEAVQPQRSRAPRVVVWLALAGVSLIGGAASYVHGLAVVEASGARPPVSYLIPALADLVILGASADLLAALRTGHGRPRLTRVSLTVGILVTLAMNVAAGWHHGWGGRLVAGWPALAFILALESLAGLVRRGRGGASLPPVPATRTVTVGCGHGVAETAEERVVEAYLHLRDCLGATPSFRDLGRAFGVHHDTAGQLVKAALSAPDEQPPSDAAGAPAPIPHGASRPPQTTLNGNGAVS